MVLPYQALFCRALVYKSKIKLKNTMQKIIHFNTGESTVLVKSFNAKYLPVHPKTPLPPYSGQPNLKLDEDIYIHEVKAALHIMKRHIDSGVDVMINGLLTNLKYDFIIPLSADHFTV